MELDSARQLKQSLFKRHVQALIEHPSGVAARAIGARAVRAVDSVQRTMALGISYDQGKGYRLAVRLQNRALERGRELEKLVDEARGEADVRYVGRIVKHARLPLQSRRRPLIIGCSVGHYNITAGTLGCFVKTKSGDTRILSNNHVLADENAGKKGDAIIQPGQYDGGKKGADAVATLDRFIRLKKVGANLVDCALATVKDGVNCDVSNIEGLGKLAGVSGDPVSEGLKVHKAGRTTATTSGRVTAFELDNVVVGYDIGNLRFDGQIEVEGAGTEPFSEGGDSGSLIVGDDREAVALLFAGGDQGGSNGKGLTYGTPIDVVLAALGVSLVN